MLLKRNNVLLCSLRVLNSGYFKVVSSKKVFHFAHENDSKKRTKFALFYFSLSSGRQARNSCVTRAPRSPGKRQKITPVLQAISEYNESAILLISYPYTD